MEFFDNKEEVMDVQLTQFGKRALAMGKFKPTTYAFFDDDILYDIKYSASSSVGRELEVEHNFGDSTQRGHLEESQNLTSERIKETPRIKTQFNFTGVESQIAGNFSTDCGPGQASVLLNSNFTPQYFVDPKKDKLLLQREAMLADVEEASLRMFNQQSIENLQGRWEFIKERIENMGGSDKRLFKVIKTTSMTDPSTGTVYEYEFHSRYYDTEEEARNADTVYMYSGAGQDPAGASAMAAAPNRIFIDRAGAASLGTDKDYLITQDKIFMLTSDLIIERFENLGIEDGLTAVNTSGQNELYDIVDDELFDYFGRGTIGSESHRKSFVSNMYRIMGRYFGIEFFEEVDKIWQTGQVVENYRTLDEIKSQMTEAVMQITTLTGPTDPQFMTSLFGNLKTGTTFDTALEEQHQGVSKGGVFSVIDTLNEILGESAKFGSNKNLYSEDFSPSLYACSPQSVTEKKYSLSAPLGNSSLGSSNAPAWSVKFANGELLFDDPYNSKAHLTGAYFSTLKVPQLETKIQFETFVTKLNANGTVKKNYTEKEDKLNFFGSLETPTFEEDNTTIQIKPDYLLLNIEEKNTDFIKENFDIEVFHVNETKNQNGEIVIDEKQLYFFDAENEEEINNSHVEYYFDLLVDNEIDPKFYCYADNVDKKNNLLSDQNLIFDCEEQEGKQENIYKIKVKKEDFKEPC